MYEVFHDCNYEEFQLNDYFNDLLSLGYTYKFKNKNLDDSLKFLLFSITFFCTRANFKNFITFGQLKID